MAGVKIKGIFPRGSDIEKPRFDINPSSKVWAFLPILVLVMGLGLALSQTLKTQNIFTSASGGAILSVAPEKSVVNSGDELLVNVLLDPKGEPVKDVYIALKYPIEGMELVDVGQTQARMHFDVPPTTVTVITQVRFKAVSPTKNATIGFSSETVVAGEDKTSLLGKTFGTTIEIK
jgi:hypothetical protein